MKSYSFWEEDVFIGKMDPHGEKVNEMLSSNAEALHPDVIIAGAGFAGLWSAFHLKRFNPALKIIIFEKEASPAGASTRNAGFACFGSLTELVDDLAFLGEPKMKQMVQMRYDGLQQIRQTFTASEIDYQELGGYELISRYQYPDQEMLSDDIREVNKILKDIVGKEDLFSVADDKITAYGFAGTDHLVENKLEGQLHPGKLMRQLVSALFSSGVSIIYGTGIRAYEKQENTVVVTTESGEKISTSKFVICTNALAGDLSEKISITPARGQVLLTSSINELPFSGCFHYDEGYYYFRNLEGKVLLGGARNLAFAEEESTEMVTTELIQDELERFLREVVIPGKQFTIEKRWSGIMGMAETKFPLIKEIESDVFCAVGMGGIGIAIAPEVGKMISEMMYKTIS